MWRNRSKTRQEFNRSVPFRAFLQRAIHSPDITHSLESAGNEVEALGGFAAGGALALRYEKYNYDEDLRSFLDLLLARLTDPKKELIVESYKLPKDKTLSVEDVKSQPPTKLTVAPGNFSVRVESARLLNIAYSANTRFFEEWTIDNPRTTERIYRALAQTLPNGRGQSSDELDEVARKLWENSSATREDLDALVQQLGIPQSRTLLIPSSPIFFMRSLQSIRFVPPSDRGSMINSSVTLIKMVLYWISVKNAHDQHRNPLADIYLHSSEGWADRIDADPTEFHLGRAAFEQNLEWLREVHGKKSVCSDMIQQAATWWIRRTEGVSENKFNKDREDLRNHLRGMVNDLLELMKATEKELHDRQHHRDENPPHPRLRLNSLSHHRSFSSRSPNDVFFPVAR